VDVVAQEAHLEVAHGDARKAGRVEDLGGDALVGGEEVVEDLEAVEGVLVAQELVEEEELQQDVADEEDLGAHVDEEQVVALALAEHHAAELAEEAAGAGERARLDLALHLQGLVHVLGQVAQRLLLRLRVQVLDVVDRLDERADVEAGLGAEVVPDDGGRVEHERLDHEDEGHPLVVGDVRFLEVVGPRHFVLPGQVVGVGHPAYVVCVFDV